MAKEKWSHSREKVERVFAERWPISSEENKEKTSAGKFHKAWDLLHQWCYWKCFSVRFILQMFFWKKYLAPVDNMCKMQTGPVCPAKPISETTNHLNYLSRKVFVPETRWRRAHFSCSTVWCIQRSIPFSPSLWISVKRLVYSVIILNLITISVSSPFLKK